MPCNSDYLKQTDFEAAMQEAARHCVYVCAKLQVPCPTKFKRQAEEFYADDVGQVEFLCEVIRKMTVKQMNDIVYNGRDRDSRRLADWWDEHLAADKAREEEEAQEKRRQEIYEKALIKLSDEEIDVLKEML